MKLRLVNIALALSVSSSLYASDFKKPDACPTVEALQHVGVATVTRDSGNGQWFGVIQSNHFGTKQEWSFGIWPIQANDRVEAVAKANSYVAKLLALGEPIHQSGGWSCGYANVDFNQPDPAIPPEGLIQGMAMTPPQLVGDIQQFKQRYRS